MTVAEASCANAVISAVIDHGVPVDERLTDALAGLADGPHRRLSAGWSGNTVRRALADRQDATAAQPTTRTRVENRARRS